MVVYLYIDLVDKNVIPDNCIYFYCSNLKLTSLPNLPKSLLKLQCCYNKLTKLPDLPLLLEILICDYNNLTELPEFSIFLECIWCSNNPIQYITKHNYEFMKQNYLIHKDNINIDNTQFFNNSGLSKEEFFSEDFL